VEVLGPTDELVDLFNDAKRRRSQTLLTFTVDGGCSSTVTSLDLVDLRLPVLALVCTNPEEDEVQVLGAVHRHQLREGIALFLRHAFSSNGKPYSWDIPIADAEIGEEDLVSEDVLSEAYDLWLKSMEKA
jgi:hypothetical protein